MLAAFIISAHHDEPSDISCGSFEVIARQIDLKEWENRQ
jgi:hypothetical protein